MGGPDVSIRATCHLLASLSVEGVDLGLNGGLALAGRVAQPLVFRLGVVGGALGDADYGRGSSGRSGSMLMKSRENAPKVNLSLYSYSRFMAFREEFDVEFTFRKTGFLSVVPASEVDRYSREHQIRQDLGVPSSVLTPDEIIELAPGVAVSDIVFGLYCPDDGEIDPQQIMAAYHRAALALGVEFSFAETAIGIDVSGSRVTAVRTERRRLPCDVVVNAAGGHARDVGNWVGVDLPIRNLRRSLYIGHTSDSAFLRGPMVEDAHLEWYYKPLGKGAVLVGMGREDSPEVRDGPNLDYLPEVRRVAGLRAPGLADFTVTGGSSGIRPVTPDILPIIGPVPGVAGFINSCGWGGEGIMHSPAGGALVADWVIGSSECPVAGDAFLYERFLAF